MNLIIIDDTKTFREGLKTFIQEALGHNVISTYKDGEQFLKNNDYLNADIVLMDIEMPILNGHETMKAVLSKWGELKVIAITNHQTKESLTKIINSGFKGCVFKNHLFDELENAINKVQNGNTYFPNTI